MAAVKEPKAKEPKVDNLHNASESNLEIVDGESREDKKKAKKEAKKEEKKIKKLEKKSKAGKKSSKVGLIIAALLILVVGSAIAIVALDLFGVRERYLSDIIKNIPIVNNIINNTENDDILYKDRIEQLMAENNRLESELSDKDNEIQQLRDTVDAYATETAQLRQIEQQQAQFRADKEAFETAAALDNKDEFQRFFETFDPDRAAEIYSQIIPESARSKEVSDYLNTIRGLDPQHVARILESLMETDMELVVLIVSRLDQRSRIAILDEFSVTNAATLLKQLSPEF